MALRGGVLSDESASWSDKTEPLRTVEVVGPTDPHLVVLTGERVGRHVPIGARVVLGRGVDCDLQLDAEDISRRHAEVKKTATGFEVRDLGSHNGTWVNGVPVESQAVLPGDRIRLGARTLVLVSLYGDVEEQLLHQQRLEAIGVVASSVAHDFNNLMAVVMGNAEFLEMLLPDLDATAPGAAGALGDLITAARHAVELSRQLLALSRKKPAEEQLVELPPLVDEMLRLLRGRAGDGVQLSVALTPPLVVLGDPAQLRQVLLNLCVNALDAMPQGGTLAIRGWREVRVGGEVVQLEVSDTGVGMSAEACRRAFEPFYTTKALGRGTGLGLALVKRIVTNHGGEVAVSSALGEGSTFRLWLPVRTQAEKATPPTRPAVTMDLAEVQQKGPVLVLEKDVLQSRALQRHLEHLGHPTHLARTVDDAAHLLAAAAPTAAIVDLDSAGDSLEETCRRLRAAAPGVQLVVSSGAEPSSVVELSGDLVQGILPKPYLRADLVALLRRLGA